MSERDLERVSKRVFLDAWECDARGWYAARAGDGPAGFGDQWRFWVGHEVQRLAQEWLGAGDLMPLAPIGEALEATHAAMATSAANRVFEATFLADAMVARADALERTGDGWRLIEIKSGKAAEHGKVEKRYIDDVAFTLMVARRAGASIHEVALVLLNPEYRRGGTEPLFVRVDVTTAASLRAHQFDARATALTHAVLEPERPPVELRFACRKCAHYTKQCVGIGVEDPLWLLPRLSEKRFDAMRSYGRIRRLPADVELTEPQRRVFDVLRAGKPRQDGRELTKLLAKVRWPVAYVDFETVNPALPWFEGGAAHDVLPFQYSVHLVHTLGGTPEHHEYLAPLEGDWRESFVERLLQVVQPAASVVVYSSYEKVRLRELAERFPRHADAIDAVIARMFDLEVVFKQAYWHPGFEGRTSIKRVLPVLVPDETLSYKSLPVNNGDDALGLFGLMRMGALDPMSTTPRREELLRYCALDTLGMVHLHRAVAALMADTEHAEAE